MKNAKNAREFRGRICLLLAAALIAAMLPAHAAPSVGDILGDVLYTNVRTYINGERIPSYNISNRMVVLIADLRYYGFDVAFDSETRVSSIRRNYSRAFEPLEIEEAEGAGIAGAVAFQYVHTDITAVIGGREVESFNIRGRLAVFFDSLRYYGMFDWDDSTRSSRLTLFEGRIVITPTGQRYHFDNCRTVGRNRQHVTREEARDMGLTACQICRP